MARKSGSLNRNGIFDTWSRFGWFFESDDGITANVDTDVVIDGSVANAVDAAAEADAVNADAPDETTPAIMLASSAACCCCCCCWPDSGSFCCNKSGWNDHHRMLSKKIIHVNGSAE